MMHRQPRQRRQYSRRASASTHDTSHAAALTWTPPTRRSARTSRVTFETTSHTTSPFDDEDVRVAGSGTAVQTRMPRAPRDDESDDLDVEAMDVVTESDATFDADATASDV